VRTPARPGGLHLAGAGSARANRIRRRCAHTQRIVATVTAAVHPRGSPAPRRNGYPSPHSSARGWPDARLDNPAAHHEHAPLRPHPAAPHRRRRLHAAGPALRPPGRAHRPPHRGRRHGRAPALLRPLRAVCGRARHRGLGSRARPRCAAFG
jgi:hypothetical protein